MFSEPRRDKVMVLTAMCFALFMTMLDNTAVNVSLAAIQDDLNASFQGLQWVIDSYALVFASLLLTGGTLGDIYGRRQAFLWGLVIFVLGSVMCAVAPSLAVLIAGRAVQGLGSAALVPATLSLLTVAFPDPRERAQAIGVWAGVSGIALSIGPALGGLLTDTLGWPTIFLINVPVGIVALIVTLRVVRESSHPEGRSVDLPGQVLAIAWVGSLTFALIESSHLGWGSPVIVAALAFSAVTFAAFIWAEMRAASPMLPLGFYRNATFAAGNAVAFLVSFGMFGTFFFMSLFLQNVQGYSPSAAGLRILSTTLPIMVVSPLAGRLAGQYGPGLPLSVGCGFCAAGLLLLTQVDAGDAFITYGWRMSLLGIGMGLAMPTMTTAIMGAVPPARSGMASAVTNTSRQLGGVLGIALLGAVVATTGRDFVTGVHRAFAAGGGMLVAACVISVLFVHRGRRVDETVVKGPAGEVAPVA